MPEEIAFSLKKNTSISLVHDVYDMKWKPVSRRTVMEHYLQKDRTAFKRQPMRAATGPKLCADGDSWINILWSFQHHFGIRRPFSTCYRSDTSQLTWPIRVTLSNRCSSRRIIDNPSSLAFSTFSLLRGGNDGLGGGALVELLRSRAEGDLPTQENISLHQSSKIPCIIFEADT